MTDIPSIIVSGYLGSGKTSLINAFLNDPRDLRATVLVNDFGAINLDTALIENQSGGVIALTNGCACCRIGDDLLGAAQQAVEAGPDIIITEASGVAEPARMAKLLMGTKGLARSRIAALVNASAARRNAADKYIGRLFTSQLAAADRVIVNRADEFGDQSFVSNLIAKYAPLAQMSENLHDWPNLAAADFLAKPVPANHAAFATQVVTMPDTMSETQLRHWLSQNTTAVQRVKGHVRLTNKDIWVDQVQGQTSLRPCPAPSEQLRNRLVMISSERDAPDNTQTNLNS